MNIFCPVVCNSTEAKAPLTMMGKVARETNSSTSWRDLGNAASGVATPCFLASWYMPSLLLSSRISSGHTSGNWNCSRSISAQLAQNSSALSSLGIRIARRPIFRPTSSRSEEHTSELQSQSNLVCRLLLEKKKQHVGTTPQTLVRDVQPRPDPETALHGSDALIFPASQTRPLAPLGFLHDRVRVMPGQFR